MTRTPLAAWLGCIAISLLMIPGCAGKSGTATLTGTVTYRPRIALAPEAAITVRLEDSSRQDVAATLVAEFTDTAKGRQVPIPFAIAYDPKTIEAGHTYTLRATIHEGERLAFTTDSSNPVITNGKTSDVGLNLAMVGEPGRKVQKEGIEGGLLLPDSTDSIPSPDSALSTASLEGTYWKAITLAGHEVIVPEGTREAHFVLHAGEHRVAGTGGCNRFSGNYTINGDSLTFGTLASTMMACAERAMTQEKWLTEALSRATTWRITGEQLELLRDGAVIGVFRSVYLK